MLSGSSGETSPLEEIYSISRDPTRVSKFLVTHPLTEALTVSQRKERTRRGRASSSASSIWCPFSAGCSRVVSIMFADVRFGRIQRF